MHPAIEFAARARVAGGGVMPRRYRLALAMLLPLWGGCAAIRETAPAPSPSDGVDFIVVRHAETAGDDPDDPSLSPAGRARAQALAELLAREPLQAVYATEFRRTRQTAEPAAQAHGLPVNAYFSRGDSGETARQWRQRHHAGTVLIVGHSDNVADLAATLCGCASLPMDEREYDRVSVVHVAAGGRAELRTRRYGSAP